MVTLCIVVQGLCTNQNDDDDRSWSDSGSDSGGANVQSSLKVFKARVWIFYLNVYFIPIKKKYKYTL